MRDMSGTSGMRTLLVARKTLVESLREPQLLALTLVFPLFMLLITWIGYASTPKLATYPVLIISTNPAAAPLVEQIKTQRYPDGRAVFEVQVPADRDSAEAALKAQTATVLISLGVDGSGALTVNAKGDATSMKFIAASARLDELIVPYLNRAAGMPEVIRFTHEQIGIRAPQTEFDAYAPGMIIMAILLLTPHAAMLVAREIRWGTLRRLRLTSLSSWELLGGISLAEMLTGAAQVVIIFAAALLMGFRSHGSLVVAVVIGILVSFSAIGFGLLVACVSSNDSDALNIGSTASMMQVFLSGVFFAVPPLTLFTIAGHEIGLFDFLPATHGMLALQQVLSGGVALADITFRLVVMAALSLLYFVISAALFDRWQMRRTKSS